MEIEQRWNFHQIMPFLMSFRLVFLCMSSVTLVQRYTSGSEFKGWLILYYYILMPHIWAKKTSLTHLLSAISSKYEFVYLLTILQLTHFIHSFVLTWLTLLNHLLTWHTLLAHSFTSLHHWLTSLTQIVISCTLLAHSLY